MSAPSLFQKLQIPFIIFLVCVVAYLPVSSFLFSLKNDALIYNLPPKIFFSEALHYGHLPIWNPYLNFGYPIYADPGFAWWQPITWLFGLIGYNAYTFHIEVILYIYIAGLGMYWLCRKLNLQKLTALSVGCMFMCCGFFIGNLQHINFLTCTAFLPWAFGFWQLYQKRATFKHLAGFAIATYLLCTGGHPAIPIATAFFFILITFLYSINDRDKKDFKSFLWQQVKLLFTVVVFLSPLIISYLNILPFYDRSEPVNQSLNLNTGFTLPSYISLFLPFATIKNYEWFGTDVSMRNAYFSIPGVIFFTIFLMQKQKTGLQKTMLIAGIVMLFISAGGQLKALLYQNLPGFSFIKTNGEFRVFSIFSFLLCCAFPLEKFIQKDVLTIKQFKRLLNVFIGIAIFIFFFVFFMSNNKTFSSDISSLLSISGLKIFIDNINFWQSLLIALLLFVILCVQYRLFGNLRKYPNAFVLILFFDLIINAWLLLPITGVGKASVQELQNVLNKFPRGFPSPIQMEGSKVLLTTREKNLIGNPAWYNKKIELQEIDYPSKLKSTNYFFKSSDTSLVKGKNYTFFKSNYGNRLTLTSFTPAVSTFELNIFEKDTLVILQNYFSGWQVLKNNQVVPLSKHLSTFISVPVEQQDSTLAIRFSPLK